MTLGTQPAADVVVDVSLVRALLEEQHPDLPPLVPLKVAEGWDNALFAWGMSWLSDYPVARRRRR